MERLSETVVKAFASFSTTNISDALDSLGLKSGICGIIPAFSCPKIAGPVVTVKMTAAGLTPSKAHVGVEAIDLAQPGDIIVIDNGGRTDVSCWGEILGYGAKNKGVRGVIIDGAFRDVDEIREIGFPVYARCVVPVTARFRIMQESVNTVIQCGGVQVRPGDIAVADGSGVCIVPKERIEEVLEKARALYEKEQAMISDIKKGMSMKAVDSKYQYEKMLRERTE